MKLTIERAALLRALGHVQSVVERRNTIPILSNVLLRAESGELALSATDMDLEIVASVAAQGVRKGATTAPAHTLYDIVRKLREGAQIEIDAGRRQGGDDAALRPLHLHPRLPAARGLSADGRRRPRPQLHALGGRPEAAHRPHALRHLDGGDALLPQRHLPACGQEQRGADAARGGDRRPSPGADGGAAARRRHPACPASSCRARP